MPGLANVHPAERLALPDGGGAEIDLEMIPLVRALWALGLTTAGCCQNLGESIPVGQPGMATPGRERFARYLQGQAWLKLPVGDALLMLGLLAGEPTFRERLGRWTHPDAWESYVYLMPDDNGAQISDWAQIHFPKDQLTDVTEILSMSPRPPRQPDIATATGGQPIPIDVAKGLMHEALRTALHQLGMLPEREKAIQGLVSEKFDLAWTRLKQEPETE